MALSRISGVGNVIFKRLIDRFQSPRKVFQAGVEELKQVDGIRTTTVQAITRFRGDAGAEQESERIKNRGIAFLTLHDKRYPALLKTIYDPPPFLYVRGELRESDDQALAVIGSRSASAYGRETTRRITRTLAQQGFTVVSGLARGIDSTAHQGALEAGGRTIAVLGSGIDVIYPPENTALAEKIAGQGAVVTEFPLGTPPEATNFPGRNRIISGLSLGTVIVEASMRSGSLITARLALEQGREVFAIPGNINSPWSRGTNSLIKEGAQLVMNAEDIIAEILPQSARPHRSEEMEAAVFQKLSPEGKKILDLMEADPLHIDTLIQKSGLHSAQVSSILLDLELNGVIKQLSGKLFVKAVTP
ncbi:MAG: DNA-processing protein DprA [Deltaproteobacteria bacterium]|nr:DNA-processing protein DprA [Deltaproteobacteria bacterium]